jgi:NCS1 nucleoside transporter family
VSIRNSEAQQIHDSETDTARYSPATLATGALGPIFGLGFWDSFAVILIVSFVFSWVVAWFSCLGPRTGLRMMSIGRYSFGIWGTRILVLLNLCGMVGWSAVNGIAGAQVLNEVSDGRCPLWAGNLIIGVCTAIVCFLGYFAVHWFERICWIPQLIAFVFLAGYGAKHFDPSASPMGSGSAEAAGVMSFFAVVYGFIIGWAGCAADYSVRMPVDTNRTSLSVSVWAGNFFGSVSTQLLGAAFMTAVAADPVFAAAYDDRGIGGLLGKALAPLGGFGKLLLVLLALSIVGCNLVNIYSLAFMCQNFHPIMMKVPRFVWTLLGSAAYIAVAIAGEDSFAEVLESFLSIIGYYVTPFIACMAVEHFIFRKGLYPLEDWNNMDVLPYGIAGSAAIVMAFVGAVLSMDQGWYEGVVSKTVKPDGAELGWVFSLIFAITTFIPVRYLERKYTGR